MHQILEIAAEVATAISNAGPVVALESTVIAHGLPHPDNIETALAMEAAVRAAGAVPATIGVIDGRVRVGLTTAEIERLATASDVVKISRRDLPGVIALGATGGTTVAATMICAQRAGISLFATGGIGGVHRGAATSFDISADLDELARTDVAVVCSGAKAILDLDKTLEVLETRGVPVIGFGTDRFPAFWSVDSGHGVDRRIDNPQQAADILAAKRALGLNGGLLIVNPPPATEALDQATVETAVTAAMNHATKQGIRGNALTPFLLDRVLEETGGRSLAANRALLVANAGLAGWIALAVAERERRPIRT